MCHKEVWMGIEFHEWVAQTRIGHACFCLNKFGSLSIILYSNFPLSIMFEYVSFTFQPDLHTHLSLDRDMQFSNWNVEVYKCRLLTPHTSSKIHIWLDLSTILKLPLHKMHIKHVGTHAHAHAHKCHTFTPCLQICYMR